VKGNFAYDRTNPDRCYKDPKAAEKDGLSRRQEVARLSR